MNPRATFVTLMGWCPGIKAAAKFVRDREISNKRIAFSLAIVATVAISSYMLSNAVLVWAGQPNITLTKSFNSPILGVKDGRICLSTGQVTQSGSSASTGPGYLQLSGYFGELRNNGSITKLATITEEQWGAGIDQSLLLTRNKTWKLAYSIFSMYDLSHQSYSPLYVIESSDGATWSNPIIAYENKEAKSIHYPTLMELDDGSFFLLFRTNNTWKYILSKDGSWSKPSPTPFGLENGVQGEFLYESAFIDTQSKVNVIWDEGSFEGNDLGLRYSTLVNGVWSEPRILTSNSVSLNGQQPRIFFSTIQGGYYLSFTSLQQTGSPDWHPVTMLYFSRDWVDWELLSYFDTWGYSLVERGDGSLARVIEDRGAHNLYLSWSVDGRSWSSAVPVAMIVDEGLASSESAYQRSNFSYVFSFIVSLATLLIFTRVSIIRS
jgi:hypothetical protein